jgi:hypothetical protein
MVTHTWGFVKTRPGSPWTKVEVRAERGAILRVSGTSYAAVLASKRLRNNIRRLAEGKARWSGAEKVRPSDVQAAFDVTWMNRPGWWNG